MLSLCLTVDLCRSAPALFDLPRALWLVSGCTYNLRLCACFAPAGSGKTTLLAILAGSAEDLDKRSSLSGTVLMDGQPLRSATRRKVRLPARPCNRPPRSPHSWHSPLLLCCRPAKLPKPAAFYFHKPKYAACLPAAAQIAYVAQDDTLLPTLTVEECIRYSAILRQAALAPRVAWP